ncbi:Winged helix DNA-binding domain-containing protein [Parelusimicrobium proximum]|uniref:DNA glycosylase AlkZ-like family protein n=1 Tax=Parelusimicrobium proximum TaxID=3228953 RepID=UPI003D173F35
MTISREELFYIRAVKSGLIDPFDSVEKCVRSLFGVQGQAQPFAELNIFSRVKNVTAEDLEKMFASLEYIKIWAQRITAHVYHKNDWHLAACVYGDRGNLVLNYLKTDKSALERTLKALDTKEPLDKAKISAIIEREMSGVKVFYRDGLVTSQATMRGILFGVVERPHTKTYLHRSNIIKDKEWLEIKKDEGIKQLFNIYLRGYGPASVKDFLHWSGLKKKEVEHVLRDIEKEFDKYEYNKTPYYSVKKDKDIAKIKKEGVKNIVKLVGKFDPLFVAFSDKTWAIANKHQKYIWRAAAHVESVLLLGTEARGTWRYEIKGKTVNYNFELFLPVSAEDKKLIKKEIEKVSAFLGRKTGRITYKKVK